MTILRVGSNEQYANNWDAAFGGKPKKKSATKSTTKAAAKKKTAKKKTVKKKASDSKFMLSVPGNQGYT